jgi:hypothetical protein
VDHPRLGRDGEPARAPEVREERGPSLVVEAAEGALEPVDGDGCHVGRRGAVDQKLTPRVRRV